jgi:CrcB protein
MPGLKSYLFLILGGVVGVLLRYQIGMWISNSVNSVFPWPTFLINVVGSFVMGFIMRYAMDSSISLDVRLLLVTGFCGGFTTLSAFSYEFVQLMMERQQAIAFTYMGATVLIAPLVCFAGFRLAALAR